MKNADLKMSASEPFSVSEPIPFLRARMFELKYKLIDDNSVRPICPHCERKIDDEIPYFQQGPGPTGTYMGMETARLFICPHCNKVLGIGTIS